MLLSRFFVNAALAAAASAQILYVSSYSGNITSLKITPSTNDTYSLVKLHSDNGCAPNASYLHFDQHKNLYCVNENIVGTKGSLVSFKVDEHNGTFAKVNSSETMGAPVHSVLYHGKNGSQLLAIAHYASGLSTFQIKPCDASFTPSQMFNFTQVKPGPNAGRQAGSHPHQVIVDPTNNFFLVPDLGADLVRVFFIDPRTLQISPRPSINVEPGSGPRHGTFYKSKNGLQFYLVSELTSTLTSYKVDYLPDNGGIKFEPIMGMRTYGNNTAPIFNGTAASEIQIGRAGHRIIVSNRNATSFKISNPDPKNATAELSDSMATFTINESGDGTFKFGELTPAGGSFPRHFSQNKRGTLVAVGLQKSERVVIYGRDVKTGKIGTKILASFEGLGPVTSVVWG